MMLMKRDQHRVMMYILLLISIFRILLHSALLEQLEKYKAEHGTAVVMETKTEKIRAIVNLGRTSGDLL